MLLPAELVPRREHGRALHPQGAQHQWGPPEGQGMGRPPKVPTLGTTFQGERQRSCAWDLAVKFLQVLLSLFSS